MVPWREDSRITTLDRLPQQTGAATIKVAAQTLAIRQPQLLVNNFVYVNRPPLTMAATDRLATETSSNLVPLTVRPFWTTVVRQSRLTIEEDRIPNTISIDRETQSAKPCRPPPPASNSRQRENSTVKEANNLTVQSANLQMLTNLMVLQK